MFFVAAVDEGRELTGMKVCDADRKSAVQIAQELRDRKSDGGTQLEFALFTDPAGNLMGLMAGMEE
ncbi:hypothetical protein [Planobispora longispora]|uniref:Uncharacterized protein n=1 Tax=Planobispora longispora TaxID=28887 RepID=A0A8J3RU19_9ACTN|nr:hypothetical protein [Planobispora longispora]BFE79425.1 hypothetical protein GCM10020093_020260 [Planobispora longispora]GIH78238.1 hypothetical protein Plo01_46670 [Planobispora longispora]